MECKTSKAWEADIRSCVNEVFPLAEQAALSLWSNPELSGSEYESARVLSEMLAGAGFEIQAPAAETAATSFVATWGEGEPSIALLGEYDALPKVQKPGAVQGGDACVKGEPGVCDSAITNASHACGHNLLGAGSAAAAICVAKMMQHFGIPGKVSFIACPEEETLVGKGKLAQAGVFNAYDTCFSWHPMSFTAVSHCKYAALISAKFYFHGIGGHAAESPELTRSAADALELMNIGANYLREHVEKDVQIAYSIVSAGKQPNVVPDYAEGWYYVRAASLETARAAFERVIDVAQGAALMTGTSMEYEVLNECPDTRLNYTLNSVLADCLQASDAEALNSEQLAFAKSIADTQSSQAARTILKQYGFESALEKAPAAEGDETEQLSWFLNNVLEGHEQSHFISGSSDFSVASKLLPTAQVFVACAPVGTAAHSWQNAECAGSSLALRGMKRAIECLARASLTMLESSELRGLAKQEFAKHKQ